MGTGGQTARRPRLLVVEDDALVALGIRLTLEDLNYTICGIAQSEPEAVAMARETAPDLVLMDIRLKGPIDGIDTARRLRGEFNLRVIYLSAYTDGETMARAAMTFPLGFVQKPYSAHQLASALDLALRRLAAPLS